MLTQKQADKHSDKQTFSDWLRYHTRDLTAWLGQSGLRMGLTPDAVTIVGLVVVMLAAWQAAIGSFAIAGVILIAGSPLDVLDGALARAMKRRNRFGALLDSTLDRYADGFLLGSLAYYFSVHGQQSELLISLLALIGAYAVSYVRARAEGLGIVCKDGWFSRVERTLVLIGALLTGWVVAGVLILAIGSHLTALQRIALVYRATRSDETP